MANQTTALDRQRQQAEVLPYLAAAVDVYAGSLVSKNAAGYAKVSSDTAAEKFLGVADKTTSNSTGAAGAKDVRVWTCGSFTFGIAAATQANVGAKVYAVDSQTVGLTATNSVLVGIIVEVLSTTSVRVKITPDICRAPAKLKI